MPPAQSLPNSYNYGLVGLSIVIAGMASYAAFNLAGRIAAYKDSKRFGWLAGGAIAMGIGIWSMHYTGMLAFNLPVAVAYQIPPGWDSGWQSNWRKNTRDISRFAAPRMRPDEARL